MTPREVSEVVEAHRLRIQDADVARTKAAYWSAWFAKHNPLDADHLKDIVAAIRGEVRELPSDEELADAFDAFTAGHNARFGVDANGEKVKPS